MAIRKASRACGGLLDESRVLRREGIEHRDGERVVADLQREASGLGARFDAQAAQGQRFPVVLERFFLLTGGALDLGGRGEDGCRPRVPGQRPGDLRAGGLVAPFPRVADRLGEDGIGRVAQELLGAFRKAGSRRLRLGNGAGVEPVGGDGRAGARLGLAARHEPGQSGGPVVERAGARREHLARLARRHERLRLADPRGAGGRTR